MSCKDKVTLERLVATSCFQEAVFQLYVSLALLKSDP